MFAEIKNKLLKKSTLIYFIVILSIIILFNSSKTEKIVDKNAGYIEKFSNLEENDLEENDLDLIKELYIDELIYGDEILSNLNFITDLEEYEEILESLKNNMKIISQKVINDLQKQNMTTIDNYINTQFKKYINDFTLLFPGEIEEYIIKEINSVIYNNIEKHIKTLLDENNTIEAFTKNSFLDNLNTAVNSQIDNVDKQTSKLDLLETITYFQNKLNTGSEAELLKQDELVKQSSSNLPIENNTPTSNLENFTNMLNKNINLLNSFEKIQDDAVDFLENIDTSNFFINKRKDYNKISSATQNIMKNNNTNRGNYLGSNNLDTLLNKPINNLSYTNFDNNNFSSKNILPENYKKYENIDKPLKEGFASDNKDVKEQVTNFFDGLVKYLSKFIINFTKEKSGIDINNIDNNSLISYGILLIIVALFIFIVN